MIVFLEELVMGGQFNSTRGVHANLGDALLERATTLAFNQISAAQKLLTEQWKVPKATPAMTIAVAQIIATNMASPKEELDTPVEATVTPKPHRPRL